MTSGNEPKRFAINLDDLDLAKFRRVGTKVMSILNNKMSNPVEAYLLLKILCYSIEDSEGFKLMPEDEERLRKLCLEPPKTTLKTNLDCWIVRYFIFHFTKKFRISPMLKFGDAIRTMRDDVAVPVLPLFSISVIFKSSLIYSMAIWA